MQAEREQLKRIFESAVELPFGERARFLDSRCAENFQMRGEIEKLLAADDQAGSFLESSPFNDSAENPDEISRRNYIGRKIGAYQIEREIGAGGMGTVFLAMREIGDLKQKVAVKIVHQGAFSKEIIRRFLIERKILAELQHSGIARLIDAGETAENLPFLVMEYIDGVPLDAYCRDSNLSIDERLRLFRQICAAVAYAHRRLIIHRDLKPSNILVTKDGEPKLLDFGIAKLLSPSDENVSQTETLMNLLTPAYAAPEQIRGESVTTATDVYSLGVILYELLAGVRPFSFGSKNYQEIVRVICETEPPPPSSAVSGQLPVNIENTEPQKSPATNNSRRRNQKSEIRNQKFLKGDLDNIILKALRKDPERRYQAVEQFSEDVERYQKGLPVSARPDTFSYRAIKFFERNRLAVISFGIILFLLVAGIFGTTWQAVRAARQQQIAEQRFAQVREIANNVIFKYHDSIANLNGSTEVRKMLVEDATKYLDNLAQESDADENLQNELALAYAKLADVQGKPFAANTGDTSGALENYQKSIALLEKLSQSKNAANALPAEDELITTYHSKSALDSRLFNFDEAIKTQEKALDLAQKRLAPDSLNFKKRLTYGRAFLWLGDAYSEAGNFPEAVDHYRKLTDLAEDINRDAPHEKDAETLLAIAHDRIGRGLLLRGQELARTDFSPAKIGEIYRESYPHLEKASQIFSQVAAENPENQKYHRNKIDGQTNLATVLREIGQFDRSLEILRNSVADTGKSLERDGGNSQLKSDHAEDLHQLALTLNAESKYVEAAEKMQSALQIMNQLIAGDAENMELRRVRLNIIDDYGNLFFQRRDFKAALKIYQNSFDQLDAEKQSPDKLFSNYARGDLQENIGDCYAQAAKTPAISKAEEQKNLQKAANSYQNAEQLWQTPDVQRVFFSRTPEMFDYLKSKISRVKPV